MNSQEREKNAKNKNDGKKDAGDDGKASDEDSLLKLMSECNFTSLTAEKFIERLQNELLDLDTVCHKLFSFNIFLYHIQNIKLKKIIIIIIILNVQKLKYL